jgi:HEAT repeat protein
VKALGKGGDRSVIPLIQTAAKDELPTVRIAAAGALMRLGSKDAWDQLRKMADAAHPEDRAEALRTIAELKDQRGVPLMKNRLTDTQPSVRAAAARGLGHLHTTEAREAIERLLEDPVAPVRESAAAALADLGEKASIAVLLRKLGDGAFTVRAAVIAALLQLSEPSEAVAPTVLGLAQHNDPAARSSVAFALGKATKHNRPGAVAILSGLADDPLPGPKIVALRSIGHVGDRAVIPDLKAALHDQNEAVRATAAGAFLHVMSGMK